MLLCMARPTSGTCLECLLCWPWWHLPYCCALLPAPQVAGVTTYLSDPSRMFMVFASDDIAWQSFFEGKGWVWRVLCNAAQQGLGALPFFEGKGLGVGRLAKFPR